MNISKSIDFEKLESKNPKVKFGYAKELVDMSKKSPEVFIAEMPSIINLLDSDNNIIKWSAIDIIGNVMCSEHYLDMDITISLLFAQLHSGKLITCNHAILSLGSLALAKPQYRDRIIEEFAKLTTDEFDTDDCRAIAYGKVVEVVKPLIKYIIDKKALRQFLSSATECSREATRSKAEQLLKKLK